jgi:hypothetical protein
MKEVPIYTLRMGNSGFPHRTSITHLYGPKESRFVFHISGCNVLESMSFIASKDFRSSHKSIPWCLHSLCIGSPLIFLSQYGCA